MKRTLLAAALASTAVGTFPACTGHQCMTPSQEGSGLTGTANYLTPDGMTHAGKLSYVRMTAHADFELTGELVDDFGRARDFTLHGQNLTLGVTDIAGHGDVCIRRTSGGEPICSDLEGTIDVRALAKDCYSHESGVGSCVYDIEFTLAATSPWQGTRFQIEAVEQTTGMWIDVECGH